MSINKPIEVFEYNENFGSISFQDGFEKELVGKDIEKQIHCFAWTTVYDLCSVPYKELESTILNNEYYKSNTEPASLNNIISKDDTIVGFVIKNYRFNDGHIEETDNDTILPYQGYCYDISSDNNGAGYKERKWYKYLICLPYDHQLW